MVMTLIGLTWIVAGAAILSMWQTVRRLMRSRVAVAPAYVTGTRRHVREM